MLPHDELLKRLYKPQTVYRVIKLPCKHATVEILKPESQWIPCENCKRSFYLSWGLDPKFTKVGMTK